MKSLKPIVQSPWYAFFDLACVSAAILLWISGPHLGWRPLLIALLPWAIRLIAGSFPFRRTSFDLFMGIFLITAVSGLWASYNTELAVGKFWLLVGAVLLFYALAGSPYAIRWKLAALVPMAGLGSAVYFLLKNFQIRLSPLTFEVWPNLTGGPLILVYPFIIAILFYAIQERRRFIASFTTFAAILLLVVIFLSGSRAAWFAAGVTLGIMLLWALISSLARQLKIKPSLVYTLFFLAGGMLLLAFLNRLDFVLARIPEGLAGSFHLLHRSYLAQAAWKLAEDFTITGGGLESFPGLYSQYYQSIPFYQSSFSRNLYLDINLEQGFLGLLMLVFIYLGTIWVLLAGKPSDREGRILNISAAAGLLFVLLHGMVDNLIYTRWGAPFLFLIPGLVLAFNSGNQGTEQTSVPAREAKIWGRRVLAISLPLALLGLAMLYRSPVEWASGWYAGLGAVSMAKVELADFPKGRWDEGENLSLLVEAENYFGKALSIYPGNRTANHRLGMINMLKRDFPKAVAHLERAYTSDPAHMGILKAYGYSLVWNGQVEKASAILSEIPEARQELSVYSWWWDVQQRSDLAIGAKATLDYLTLNYRNE
jgi:tetratricopeptide (TPR) repeat protein